MTELPFWIDLLTAVLVMLGALVALIGAFGLVRLPTFYQRIHAPTLGTTVGVWSIALATVLQFSALEQTASVSAILIPIFVAVTMPITTIFLMRAALFRDRLAGRPVPPNLTRQINGTVSFPSPPEASEASEPIASDPGAEEPSEPEPSGSPG